jgi:hypothetical protein
MSSFRARNGGERDRHHAQPENRSSYFPSATIFARSLFVTCQRPSTLMGVLLPTFK